MEAPDRSDFGHPFVQRTRPDSADDAFMKSVQASYAAMDGYDKASLGLSPIPIIGDVAGIVNDARNYATGRQELTPANAALSALGVVPVVPSPAQIKRIVKRASPNDAAHYESVETGVRNSRGMKGDEPLDHDLMGTLERITGMFRGSDGIVRQEIDDSMMEFQQKHLQGKNVYGELPASKHYQEEVKYDFATDETKKVKRASELTDYVKNVPDEARTLDDVRNTRVGSMSSDQAIGQAWSDDYGIPYIAFRKGPALEQMDTIKHELQHVVQRAMNLSPGGNPEQFLPTGVKRSEATHDQLTKAIAQYNALPGEVEARVVAARGTMTAEQRKMYPFSVMYNDALAEARAYLESTIKKQSKQEKK